MGCYAGVPLTGTMNTITLEQSQNGFDGFFKRTVNNDDFVGDGWFVYMFTRKAVLTLEIH
jgi:hypothetical protein